MPPSHAIRYAVGKIFSAGPDGIATTAAHSVRIAIGSQIQI